MDTDQLLTENERYKKALLEILEFPFLESTEDVHHIKRLAAEALGRF